jgi:hypothetical protein
MPKKLKLQNSYSLNDTDSKVQVTGQIYIGMQKPAFYSFASIGVIELKKGLTLAIPSR